MTGRLSPVKTLEGGHGAAGAFQPFVQQVIIPGNYLWYGWTFRQETWVSESASANEGLLVLAKELRRCKTMSSPFQRNLEFHLRHAHVWR